MVKIMRMASILFLVDVIKPDAFQECFLQETVIKLNPVFVLVSSYVIGFFLVLEK